MWIKALLLAAALTGGAAVPVMASPDLNSAVQSTIAAALSTAASASGDHAAAAGAANHDAHPGKSGNNDGKNNPAGGDHGNGKSEAGDRHGASATTHDNHASDVSEVAHNADRACEDNRNCHGEAVRQAARSQGRHGAGENAQISDKPENQGPSIHGTGRGRGPAVSEVAHDADRACGDNRNCHGEAVREAARADHGSGRGPEDPSANHGASDNAGPNNSHAARAAGPGGDHGPSRNAGGVSAEKRGGGRG